MRRRLPGEQAVDLPLEDEDDADTGVEATEVVGHGGDVEVGFLHDIVR